MNSFEYIRTPKFYEKDEPKVAYQIQKAPQRGDIYYITDNPNRPSIGKE